MPYRAAVYRTVTVLLPVLHWLRRTHALAHTHARTRLDSTRHCRRVNYWQSARRDWRKNQGSSWSQDRPHTYIITSAPSIAARRPSFFCYPPSARPRLSPAQPAAALDVDDARSRLHATRSTVHWRFEASNATPRRRRPEPAAGSSPPPLAASDRPYDPVILPHRSQPGPAQPGPAQPSSARRIPNCGCETRDLRNREPPTTRTEPPGLHCSASGQSGKIRCCQGTHLTSHTLRPHSHPTHLTRDDAVHGQAPPPQQCLSRFPS